MQRRAMELGLTLALACPATVSAGAWTQAEGATYQRLSLNRYQSTADYTADGDDFELNFGGRFEDLNLTWYQEWGAADGVTLLWSVPIKRLISEGDFHEEIRRGVGDVELGARFRLLDRGVVLSLQTTAFLPWAYSDDDFMALGIDEEQLDLRLMVGVPIPALGAYAGAEIAYRARDGDPADQLRSRVEVGFDLGRRLAARIKLESIRGRDNGSFDPLLFNTRSGDQFDLDTLELTAAWRLTDGLAVEAGWAPSVGGRSTSKGETWSLAVVLTTGS